MVADTLESGLIRIFEGKQKPVRVSEGIDLSRSIEYSVFHVKGTMSPHTHARANDNKLEKFGPTFSSCVGNFGDCFYLSKSQPSFDS